MAKHAQQTKAKKAYTKGKKIYRIVSSIITVVVALFLCFVALLVIVQRGTDRSPHVFGYYMYTVLTDSMEPTIMVNDVILSKKAVPEELISRFESGELDIVTYKAESGPLEGYNLTHRIVDIKTLDGVTYVYTKGDNAEGFDAPIDITHISSVYVKTLNNLAGFIGFLKTPQGFICIIALPLLLVLVLIIISYFNDRLKIEKQNAITLAIDKIEQKSNGTNQPRKLKDMTDDEKLKLLEELQKQQKEEKTNDK